MDSVSFMGSRGILSRTLRIKFSPGEKSQCHRRIMNPLLILFTFMHAICSISHSIIFLFIFSAYKSLPMMLPLMKVFIIGKQVAKKEASYWGVTMGQV